MRLTLGDDPLPLAYDDHGIVRVVGTRIPLHRVVYAYRSLGQTPEEIVESYPTLCLADVYAVIGYYLRQRDAVDAYVAERERIEADIQREHEARFPQDAFRECLLARQALKA